MVDNNLPKNIYTETLNPDLLKSENQNDNSEGDKFEEEKKRNKRRSKNDNDGRSYICQSCQKSYLSYPALYTHIKTKHNTAGQASSRGRGRPKKDTGDINSMKLLYNPCNTDYFKHPDRIGETTDINDCVDRVFKEVFLQPNEFKFKQYKIAKENNFLNKVIEFWQNSKGLDVENSKCDEIFADYINKVSKLCKKEFFLKILKFVVIFREALNNLYKNKCRNDEEYSESHNAEDAPDISNDFVTEFIEKDPNFFDINKEDAIDITQNFSQWLYDNNYTCSKLSLISGN